MSSYLSNLLTHTTSRYNSLRRTILSNEDDGDTEDDSHISRVLRAYYTEKGRPLPPWLPADPNDRRAITPQPYITPQSGGNYLSAGSTRQQYNNTLYQHPTASKGSLNDLWDSPSSATSAPLQPQSLRNARRQGMSSQPGAAGSHLAPPTQTQARPLPSQREGSYQSVRSNASFRGGAEQGSPGSSGSAGQQQMGGSSAQERLKARLWNRAGSPGPQGGGSPGLSAVGSQNPYEPPVVSANAPWASSGQGQFDNYNGFGGARR